MIRGSTQTCPKIFIRHPLRVHPQTRAFTRILAHGFSKKFLDFYPYRLERFLAFHPNFYPERTQGIYLKPPGVLFHRNIMTNGLLSLGSRKL